MTLLLILSLLLNVTLLVFVFMIRKWWKEALEGWDKTLSYWDKDNAEWLSLYQELLRNQGRTKIPVKHIYPND